MIDSVYLSTGALVERRNNYNYNEVIRVVPSLMESGFIDGAELMVISLWYERFPAVLRDFLSAGCSFPVIHSDKDIGTKLSEAAVAASEGRTAESERLKGLAFDMFRQCCEWGQAAGSSRLVLHLWGGLASDYAVDYNIECLPQLTETATSYSIRVLCENVPSAKADPLSNWLKMKSFFGKVGLVFDTRFATCHRQPGETLSNADVFRQIEHVHISDYRGGLKEFSCLRPVFHPGEGIADFPLMFGYLRKKPLTYTLESPGITGATVSTGGTNVDELKRSLSFIRESACRDGE